MFYTCKNGFPVVDELYTKFLVLWLPVEKYTPMGCAE